MQLIAADLILVIHAAFVGFVVLSLPLILLGAALGWSWVRNLRFRLTHLACIAYVMLQAWVGEICPLTVLENALRQGAGASGYTGSFLQHWLHQLIFFAAPPWVFTLVYTVFGILVAAAWWIAPPKRVIHK